VVTSIPKRKSIAAQVVAIAVMPAALVALAFGLFWYSTKRQEIEREFVAQGTEAAAALARAAEFAIASKNLELLDVTLKATLDRPHVLACAILRLDRTAASEAKRAENHSAISAARRFEAPVHDPGLTSFGALAQPRIVGTAQVSIDPAILLARRAALHWTTAGSLAIVLGLLIAGSVLWARRLSSPLTTLSDMVRRLTRGDLAARIEPRGRGEIRALEEGVNNLARVIGDNQRQLFEKIQNATVALKAQRDEAAAASQAKSRFLAVASHDLRQPMHALGLFCTALERRIQEPEQRKLLGSIQTSLHAMEGLFDSLLDLSRLDAGRVAANMDRVPLQEVFNWLDLEYGAAARDKGLRFRVRQTDAWVQADITLLRRILMNLVANAIRYTSKGGVLVGAQRRGESMRISVWDTGTGIDAAARLAIFDEFVQLSHGAHEKTKGLGLGLAIAKRSAELMGTAINVESEPGRGSMFSIALVNARSRSAPRPVAPSATSAHVSSTAAFWVGKRVLVIEDDEAGQQAMVELLEQWGCIARACDSVSGAHATVSGEWCPDLILSDYRLRAGETGPMAIARVQEKLGAHIPVVIISGELSLSTDAATLGHSDWVVVRKPASAPDLRAAMLAAVEAHGSAATQRSAPLVGQR
jgi:signal transduction histidine kinase/ActR/RegA family two-component response regulator